MIQRCLLIAILLACCVPIAYSQLSWMSNNGPYFARIDDYAIGLKNGNVVLYAADSSENSLMKSTDRGETWQHVLTPGAAVRCVATFSSNADIVYAGVRDGGQPSIQGVWKSTDGGQTWSHLGSQPQNRIISRISIHPTDSTIIWVGCLNIPVLEPPPVLYRSEDGGLNWTPFQIGGETYPNRPAVSDIAVAEHTEYVWVSTYTNGALGIEGIWRTTNGGETWTQEVRNMDTDNLNLGSLALDPNNPDVLYAGNRVRTDTTPRKMYRTTNATSDCEWTEVYSVSSGVYSFSDIRVSPFSSDVVYVATGGDHNGIGVFKSTDGGENWTAYSTGIYPKRLRAIELDPDDDSFIYTGGTGAHYKSIDGGSTWQERNTGLLLPHFNAVAKSGSRMMSAGEGFFYRSANEGTSWQVVFDETFMSGNTKDIAFDPNDDDFALVTFGIPNAVVAYRTTNAGESWQLVLASAADNGPASVSGVSYQSSGSDNVYASIFAPTEAYVAKSTNRGANWTASLSLPSTNIRLLCVGVSSATIYSGGGVVGSNAAIVYKSINGGSSWSQFNTGLPTSSNSFVFALAIDPVSANTVYAATTSGMYKTTDGGDNWSAINSGITYTNMKSVLVHPENSNVVYAASNDGSDHAHFYRSTNAGASWSEMSTGLPQGAISDLAMDATNPNMIIAATDSGVYHIAHRWTGELAVSATWHADQTYLVEGTLTVPAGKALVVDSSVVVQALSGATIVVEGELAMNGTSGNHIASTAGIVFQEDGTGEVTYVDFTACATAVRIESNEPVSIDQCSFDNVAIGVKSFSCDSYSEPFRAVTNSSFSNYEVGILVDNFSNLLIQGNTLVSSDVGVVCVNASPRLLQNYLTGHKYALAFEANSSPELEDASFGGNNIVFENQVGVLCENGSNANLGLVTPPGNDQGGQNSIYANNTDVQLISDCIVSAEKNWWGSEEEPTNFDIDGSSSLDYDPWLDTDPNSRIFRPGGGGRSPVIAEDDARMNPGRALMRQAMTERKRGQFADAMNTLKSIVAAEYTSAGQKSWAVMIMLAISHRVANPNLAEYLSEVGEELESLGTTIASVMPGVYLREGNRGRGNV